MSKMTQLFPLVLLAGMLVGCSSTITNLTPSKMPRNASGMYPVEVAWDSRQQTLKTSTLQPVVQVDFQQYPMRPTLGMKNRWETVIPVPPDKNSVNYQIRFDYDYNTFGRPQKNSRLSSGYRLDITDK